MMSDFDAPVEEADGAVREGRHVGLMRHHDDGEAALVIEPGQELHDLMAARGVEIAGRLVGEQHQRIGDDGARDGDALLLAARKLRRRVMLAARRGRRDASASTARSWPLALAACRDRSAAVRHSRSRVVRARRL